MDTDIYSEGQLYESIKDELDCAICREIFSHPKSLSCGHVFCCNCLRLAAKSSIDTFSCPTCRRPTPLPVNGIDGLPNNYQISSLAEAFTKQDTIGKRRGVFMTVTEVDCHITSVATCKEHNKQFDLFCEDCNDSICATCLIERHKGHTLKGTEEKSEELLKNLKITVPISHRLLENSTKAADRIKEEKQALQNQKDKVIRGVNSYFTMLHEAIAEREKMMTESIGIYYHLKMSRLDEALLPMESHSCLLSEQVASVRSISKDKTSLSSIRRFAETLEEQNREVQLLLEKADNIHLSNRFLSFNHDRTMLPQLHEVGTLNECVFTEEDGAGKLTTFKVKRKINVQKDTSNMQLEYGSPTDSLEELCTESDQYQKLVQHGSKHQDEEVIYDDLYLDLAEKLVLVPPPPSGRPPEMISNQYDVPRIPRQTPYMNTAEKQLLKPYPPSLPSRRPASCIDLEMIDNQYQVAAGIPTQTLYMNTTEEQLLIPPPLPSGRPSSPCVQMMGNQHDVARVLTQQIPHINLPSDLHLEKEKKVKVIPLKMVTSNLHNIVQPWGVAVNPNTTDIYITDTGNHCVLMVSSAGTLSRVIGSKGQGKGQFTMPVDVTLDEKCNIFVADRMNGCVQKFTPTGKFKLRFKSGEDLKQPNGLAVFRSKIYVSDREGSKIVIFDQNGMPLMGAITSPPSVGPANPFQPAGIAIHPKFEKIYVADRCNHQVLVFNNDGELVHSIGSKGQGEGELLFPNGVTITSTDLLLVTETENHRISVFYSKTGKYIKSFGKPGEDEGMFIIPRHITTNRHGEVYVTDEKNQRIQIFKYEVVQEPSCVDIKREGIYIQ